MFAQKENKNDRIGGEEISVRHAFPRRFGVGLVVITALLLGVLAAGCSSPVSLDSNGVNATTRQETMTVPLTAVRQIYICDKTGSVVVRTADGINAVTMNISRIVHTTNSGTIAQQLQTLKVSTQNIGESSCSWLPKEGDGSTLVVSATSPDDQNFLKGNKNRIDLEIVVPSTMIAHTSPVTTRIEAGNDIDLGGFSGGALNLLSAGGNVTLNNMFLSADTTIRAQSGDITFNGGLLGNNTKNDFRSNAGNINIKLPAATNVTIDASAPTGNVSDDFASSDVIQQTIGGEWYKGPLNPDGRAIAPIRLTLTADTGDVTINKA